MRAAILASDPHDTQRWLFKIGDNAIAVFADRLRNLGTFDPFRREMHLGLGATVENLVLAARAFGLAAEVKPADGGLTLSPGDAPALAAQPLNQPVERVDRDMMLGKADSFGQALANFATAPGWEPTFVFRLGIPERPADPSPRRALNEVLRM